MTFMSKITSVCSKRIHITDQNSVKLNSKR